LRGLVRSGAASLFFSPWIASPDLPWARSWSRKVGLRLLFVPSPLPLFSRIVSLLRGLNDSGEHVSPPARRRREALRRRRDALAEEAETIVEPGARAGSAAPNPVPAAQDRTRFIPRERTCAATPKEFDMFTRTISAIAAAGLTVATLALATPLEAAPLDEESKVVRISDLDLSTDKGVAALNRRVRSAARDICGWNPRADLALTSVLVECENRIVASARPDVELAIASAQPQQRLTLRAR
jgi:UrcA family protein